jgi:polyisoprenoid-binding protein YceI
MTSIGRIGLEAVAARANKRARDTAAALALLGVLLSTSPVRADAVAAKGSLSFATDPGATLELDGDSTLHKYSAKADGVAAQIAVDSARAASVGSALGVEGLIRGHFVSKFELTVVVDKLHSGDAGLDKNMRKALKGDQYKEIRFRMDAYDVPGPPTAGAPLTIVLHGRLSLAGVERKIDVQAVGTSVRDGLRLSGSKALLMTDYGITPPKMMLGTIKTANLITVKFNATLRKGPTT